MDWKSWILVAVLFDRLYAVTLAIRLGGIAAATSKKVTVRVVLDTNILVAALLRGGQSVCGVVRGCLTGAYAPLIGAALYAEYSGVSQSRIVCGIGTFIIRTHRSDGRFVPGLPLGRSVLPMATKSGGRGRQSRP